MFYRKFILACTVSVFFLACSAGKEARNSSLPPSPPRTAYADTDTGIVFVIMKIYEDSLTHSNKVVVQDKIYTSGRLKNHAVGLSHLGSSITCILYQGDKVIDSVRLEHPLHQHIEYTDENNQMKTKEIHLKEAEFSVRFQLKGKADKIKVIETLDKNKTQELKTIPL